jgi:hypothetical protein
MASGSFKLMASGNLRLMAFRSLRLMASNNTPCLRCALGMLQTRPFWCHASQQFHSFPVTSQNVEMLITTPLWVPTSLYAQQTIFVLVGQGVRKI